MGETDRIFLVKQRKTMMRSSKKVCMRRDLSAGVRQSCRLFELAFEFSERMCMRVSGCMNRRGLLYGIVSDG